MSVIGLQSTEYLTQAGRKVFAHHLIACKRIEAIHNMRVTTRRFWTAIPYEAIRIYKPFLAEITH